MIEASDQKITPKQKCTFNPLHMDVVEDDRAKFSTILCFFPKFKVSLPYLDSA